MDDSNSIQITRRLCIPLGEIDWEFATAGGPGGQHVNRANTKATLCFDVVNSDRLSERQRQIIMKALSGRISKEGVLRVTCGRHRSQSQNREECLERFQTLLHNAFQPEKKRRKTRPSRASKERRIENKKRRSRRKEHRQRPKEW